MSKEGLALPTNYAFVVQFRPLAGGRQPRYEGRVEHLVSGQAAHFHSWEHLREFIEQLLLSVSENPHQ